MTIVFLDAAKLGRDVSANILRECGPTRIYQVSTDDEQVKERISDADIVISYEYPLSAELLEGTSVKYIISASESTDHIDLTYAKRNKIQVSNISGYATMMAAQHTMALYFALSEKIIAMNEDVQNGNYTKDGEDLTLKHAYQDLSGRTWGIIGMGRVGRRVAMLAQAFGCKVIYHSPSYMPFSNRYEHVSFEELLAQSDIISIHTKLTRKTRGLFQYPTFCRMNPTTYLINMAHGEIIDEKALIKALNEQRIQGAALDVLPGNYLDESSPLASYKDQKRLLITPHMGNRSMEAREKAILEIKKKIEAYLEK